MERDPKPTYNIRQATPEDAVAVRRLQADSWLATYPSEDNGVSYEWVKNRTDSWLTPESLEISKGYFERAINDPNGFYRLASSDDSVIGFVHLSANEDDTKELESIYTDPATFGTGLGAELMGAAMEWVGSADTTLTVASYNERAIRFYQKNGFEIVKDSEHTYAGTMPVVRMIRKGEKS